MSIKSIKTKRKFTHPMPKIPFAGQAWRGLVGGRNLVLEIGAGVGLHPIRYSHENPEKFVIAIERTKEKFSKMQRRLNSHNIDNMLAIHADAVDWIHQNIFLGELSEVFILYPNPYPKASQKNKRFMHMPFTETLFNKMSSGAKLTMASNEEFYIQEAYELWKNDPYLNAVKFDCLSPDFRPRTHFEQKYQNNGQKLYQITCFRA